jgi:8-oxo-dGTP pyrophosphatase MutT (NUDIX family)
MFRDPLSSTYDILAWGNFSAAHVTQVDTATIHALPAHVQTIVDRRWDEALARATEEGRRLFNALVYRLDDLRVHDGRMHISYGRTCYRDYAMTRGTCAAKPWANNPDPIGSAVIASTTDGFIPLGRRSRSADVNPGRYFTFGGFFDPEDVNESGNADIFQCAAREWKEETGLMISPDNLSLISVVYDLVHPHPEIGFFTRLQQSRKEISKSDWAAELDDLIFLQEDKLVDFARANADEFVDSLLGAIEAFGLSTMGDQKL